MNILFFTHEKTLGGSSKALIDLIDQLNNGQNKIYVIGPIKDAKIANELKKRNIEYFNFLYGWWQVPTAITKIQKLEYKILYLLNKITIKRIIKKVKDLNIDIIHSNTSVIDIGARVAKKLNIKHVWHFREFTGTHLKFILGEKKSYNFINNNTEKIIYVSNAIREFYEPYIRKNLGTTIYDGVPEKYAQMKKKESSGIVKFLLVGTLEKNKGQWIAIEAANELIKKGINDFEIDFAGGNPTNYKKILDDTISKYKLKKQIKFLGFVSDLKAKRMETDVELMCSPNEAFGLVTIEAMMSSNPVIGSCSGATKELIEDGKNGLYFEKENPKDLALKMEEVIRNKKMIREMGDYAYKYAKENYTSEINAKKITEIYKNLI